jgi:hypothetical protein
MKHDLPPFALLIDADNVRQDSISPIIEEMTRHARITVRRIYGDFTSQNLAGWKVHLAEHAIHPVQQYQNTVGKNASDSALIIDAMDLLHSRRFEGFCIVSSDSDFTRLATRIREDGLVVYGFGESKAPKAFVNACDRYIYVENLLAPPELETVEINAKPERSESEPLSPEPTSGNQKLQQNPALMEVKPSPAETKLSFMPPAMAVSLLMRAHTNVADELGWALLGQMSSYIHANHPAFDSRTYGCEKFIELIQKTCSFELVQKPYKNGHSYFCRPARATRTLPTKARTESAEAPSSFNNALVAAVTHATASNGWALVGTIGQKLKALNRGVKESGHQTLTDALKATGLFDMRGSGAARYFRVKKS